MALKEKLQAVGAVLMVVVGIAAAIALGMAFIYGASWLSATVFPYIVPVTFWTLLVCLVALVPLSFVPSTRAVASVCLFIASFVFGFLLWVWSFIATLVLWGVWGVVIGLFLAGVGIVPVAVLAVLLHAKWHMLWDVLFLIVLTFSFRMLGFWVASKVDD